MALGQEWPQIQWVSWSKYGTIGTISVFQYTLIYRYCISILLYSILEIVFDLYWIPWYSICIQYCCQSLPWWSPSPVSPPARPERWARLVVPCSGTVWPSAAVAWRPLGLSQAPSTSHGTLGFWEKRDENENYLVLGSWWWSLEEPSHQQKCNKDTAPTNAKHQRIEWAMRTAWVSVWEFWETIKVGVLQLKPTPINPKHQVVDLSVPHFTWHVWNGSMPGF